MIRDKLRVACVSMNSQANKPKNIKDAESYIQKAVQDSANWVILPELFSYIGPYKDLYESAEFPSSPALQHLAQLAQKYKITIFAPMPERTEGEAPKNSAGFKKVYNTLFIFGPDGKIIDSYRKAHLFHLKDGDNSRAESEGFIAGNKLLTFSHEGWQVACAICYDIRFPEFLVSLNRKCRFDVLALPSAFTLATGKAHWELLLKARAVEYQAYVLGANQTGLHYENNRSFGHAMIIDPWGDILAQTDSECGIAIADLDRSRIISIRKRIPVDSNRRPDLYK